MSTTAKPASWLADFEAGSHPDDSGGLSAFSGDVTDWLAIGADLRAAYIYARPDDIAAGETDRDITNSFFLMQADLYHTAQLSKYLTLVLDVGVYSGFEAWGLFHLWPSLDSTEIYLKAGRVMAPFGIREVEHQLFTREVVGFGSSDRDTGLELSVYAGPLGLNVALLNGTLGNAPFDSGGTERRRFEKAVAARLTLDKAFQHFRLQAGLSYYFNHNINRANPLFVDSLSPGLAANVGEGVNENRGSVFLTASLGRFTYLGELVLVHDAFSNDEVTDIIGYTNYQELSFIALQGLELVITGEFMEPDIDVPGNTATRLGFVVELFPIPFTEIRAMVRRLWSDASATGGVWDVVLFAHVFM